MQTLPIIVNRTGGVAAATGDKLREQIESAFADSTSAIDIQILDGEKLGDAMARVVDAPKIVVGGGDGTVACAAEALADKLTALALLPLGTLNHFARDLGIPHDLEEAAALALTGSPTSIDLGSVNGYRFINNASIGLYPSMVSLREHYRATSGLPKWLASVPAAWTALSQLRHNRLYVDTGAGREPVITPLLFVGNNIYSLQAGEVGSRASLCDGLFCVFAVERRSRMSLLWFGLRTIMGRANRTSDFVLLGECAQLTVTARSQSTDVGLDGEVRRLNFPLEFEIEPGALNVICPPGATSTPTPSSSKGERR